MAKRKVPMYDEAVVGLSFITFMILLVVGLTLKPINIFYMGFLLLLFSNLYFTLKFNDWFKKI